ncbi:hypothetical protein SLA2020_021600 [Shorea laevis]
MVDVGKHFPIASGAFFSDLFSLMKTRRTVAFAYGFTFAFVLFTVFLAFNPSSDPSALWFTNIFTSGTSTSGESTGSYKSQLSSFFSYFFSNNSSQQQQEDRNFTSSLPTQTNTSRSTNSGARSPVTGKGLPFVKNSSSTLPSSKNTTSKPPSKSTEHPVSKNQTQTTVLRPNQTENVGGVNKKPPNARNQTLSGSDSGKVQTLKSNQASIPAPKPPVNKSTSFPVPSGSPGKGEKSVVEKRAGGNNTSATSLTQKQGNETKQSKGSDSAPASAKQGIENLMQSLMNCDLFDGNWVRDDSYPLYKAGSCSLIDEQFNCILNGRPDKGYQKMKWKPKGCTLPRLNGTHMLELLRGKRLVFVGDSLNRNMWESLVCILRSAARNPMNVYEANGRSYFRGEFSYSFIFKDYNCTVDFFVSPFLVREWEVADKNGTKKETLRLDLVGKSADQYKDADIIIFNTGHWWTHEKTSKGKDYYQEGSHVYNELNVLEAFRKAMTTWSWWVDANINPMKSMVFFRGYSDSHFSGGQWNSGGACDNETEPIKNEKYLTPYPSKMLVLERVLRGMKTHVTYLNITRLTDFRKDGHPSIYRKQKLTEEERRSPLLYQDCSHWCLPGVPDAWNELLYAELLVKESKMRQHQRRVQELLVHEMRQNQWRI